MPMAFDAITVCGLWFKFTSNNPYDNEFPYRGTPSDKLLLASSSIDTNLAHSKPIHKESLFHHSVAGILEKPTEES